MITTVIQKKFFVAVSSVLLLLIALFLLYREVRPRPPQEPNLVTVTVREGLTAAQTSELLLKAGALRNESLSIDLEGYLFPDTYEFFVGSRASAVEKRMRENFNNKAMPLFAENSLKGRSIDDVISVASLIEREVPGSADRRLVSGIIWKRLEASYPLQIDSSICYVLPGPCSFKKDELDMDSPYNTYKNKGLPPTPVSNPGLDAIKAALYPTSSPFWFYLSEPKTGKTIFARDLGEHTINVHKYLK